MKIHKCHAQHNKTVCSIDWMKLKTDRFEFLRNNVKGHWKSVTCKNCLRRREIYESELKSSQKYNFLFKMKRRK